MSHDRGSVYLVVTAAPPVLVPVAPGAGPPAELAPSPAVPVPSAAASGPTTAPDHAVTSGRHPVRIAVLANDIDPVAALVPGSLTIAAAPSESCAEPSVASK